MTTVPTSVPPQRFVVTDIDIPFWRLVVIMIKWGARRHPGRHRRDDHHNHRRGHARHAVRHELADDGSPDVNSSDAARP
jgi:hypothetical protein